MRVAVVSDIHGNIWALEAVLRDISEQGADLVLNTGDLLSGPLEPSATADLLMNLDWPTLRGNHERQLLACEHHPGGHADQYAFLHTTEAQRQWLRELPAYLAFPKAGIHACHGTPASDLIYFLEHVAEDGAHLASREAVERTAIGVDASLILCGHSHKPRVFALADGRLVVNPGSVGLQAYDDDMPFPHVIENGSPHARYALCQRHSEHWNVSLRCVSYDHHKAAEAARHHGSETWARWLSSGRV